MSVSTHDHLTATPTVAPTGLLRHVRWAFGGVWAALAVYSLAAGLPDNPLQPDLLKRRVLYEVFPQGWGFFTRDPQEPQTQLLHETPAGLVPVDLHNSTPRNLFGLSRRSRVELVELAGIMSKVKRDVSWSCRTAMSTCIATDTFPQVVVSNTAPKRLLCGPLLVKKQAPLPLAWARFGERATMPYRISRLDVRC